MSFFFLNRNCIKSNVTIQILTYLKLNLIKLTHKNCTDEIFLFINSTNVSDSNPSMSGSSHVVSAT